MFGRFYFGACCDFQLGVGGQVEGGEEDVPPHGGTQSRRQPRQAFGFINARHGLQCAGVFVRTTLRDEMRACFMSGVIVRVMY